MEQKEEAATHGCTGLLIKLKKPGQVFPVAAEALEICVLCHDTINSYASAQT